MKNVVILGSTGTIGLNTLEVIRRQRKKFNVIGLACKGNKDLLSKQIEEFNPEYVYMEEKDLEFEKRYKNVKFFHNEDGLIEISKLRKADIIVFAIPGIKSLKGFIEALKNRKKIALATKEILVSAGPIIEKLKGKYKGEILPVDSEHNAIFQILNEENKKVRKIYLTASGGPFLKKKEKDVRVKDALSHPVWKMGKKITIDSATMMNKAFEMIEAHYLFSFDENQIDVVIHPEAIIHGMVEFVDRTLKCVCYIPDMKFPINYVLNYPERVDINLEKIDFSKIKSLNFEKVKEDAGWFTLGKEAIKREGSFPVVLNGANEKAVELFLENKIDFYDIIKIIEKVVVSHEFKKEISVEDVFYYHNWAREKVMEITGVKK